MEDLISFYINSILLLLGMIFLLIYKMKTGRHFIEAKVFFFIASLMIVFFPPQYYKEEHLYEKLGKFKFLFVSKEIDIYFFSYEILSFVFISLTYYILFIRNSKS